MNNSNIETTSALNWLVPVFVIFVVALFLFLVYYWFKYFLIKKKRVEQAMDLVMLQVLIPKEVKKKEEQNVKEDFREIISVAEQLYSSLGSIYDQKILSKIIGQQRISFEIIAKGGEILFYVGTPKKLQSFIEKQIHSFYSTAQVEQNKDFKILQKDSPTECGSLELKRKFIYPLKTYKKLESDPLNGITNTLSKLDKNDRIGIQLLLKPTSGDWRYATSRAARWVQEGKFIGENEFLRILYLILDNIAMAGRGAGPGE